MKGVLAGAVVLGATAGGVAPAAAAEVRETDDYVAVIIEAEDYVSLDERWVPTDAMTAPSPETDPDPDGNHSDGASGGVYLEVLPDHRQKHELTVPEGTPLSESLWGKPGTGPSASYAVDFPEPGRYHVHVRAFTTGTEDNGLHIGLNGEWPSSGAALQICTAAAREWRWSDKKRDSGGQSCGIRHTIWLDVAEAGPATVWISAREDGFEIDRMMLIKDRSDNTKACAPVFNHPDNIACEDGGIEAADELVDLEIALEGSFEEGLVGDRVEVAATIGNRDRFDFAHDVELVFAADADDWGLVEASEGCEPSASGDEILCTVGQVGPAPVEEDARFELTLEALRDGLLRVEASATADEVDDTPDNDVGQLLIEIDEPVIPTALAVELGGLPGMTTPGAATVLEFSVTNTGDAEALDTRLALSVPAGLDTGVLPGDCTAAGGAAAAEIDCLVGALGVGESRRFALTVTSEDAGDYAIGAQASAANAPASDAAASLDVSEPEESGDADAGDAGGDGDGDAGGEGDGGVIDAGGADGDGDSDGDGDGGDAGTDGDTDDGGDVTDEDGDDANGDDTSGGDDGSDDTDEEPPVRSAGADANGGATGPLLALTLALLCVARRRGMRRAV